MGFVPAATLGALVVNWNGAWDLKDTINRICTGLSTALLVLTGFELVWQILLHANAPTLQLCVMLLAATFGGATGINPQVSDRVIKGVNWPLSRARWLVIAAGIAIGGMLGFLLTIGFPLSLFTFFGILVGSLIALALVTRVDQMYHSGIDES
jgi:hypothetical protein